MRIGSWRIEKEKPDVLKGLVAGLAAGLCATYLKNKFQTVWNNVESAEQTPKRGPKPKTSDEPATVKAASAATRPILHRPLTKKEKELAGPMVDYGFGTLAGVVYGATAEFAPAVTAGGGTGYGAAVWLFADEIGVPAAGLAKRPQHYPAKTHAYALSSHVVYGLAAELVRRIVRKSLS
jgi:putative membrane protein